MSGQQLKVCLVVLGGLFSLAEVGALEGAVERLDGDVSVVGGFGKKPACDMSDESNFINCAELHENDPNYPDCTDQYKFVEFTDGQQKDILSESKLKCTGDNCKNITVDVKKANATTPDVPTGCVAVNPPVGN